MTLGWVNSEVININNVWERIGIKMQFFLLRNSWQKGRVKLIIFLHTTGKLVQALKHFPSPYMWPVNLGIF